MSQTLIEWELGITTSGVTMDSSAAATRFVESLEAWLSADPADDCLADLLKSRDFLAELKALRPNSALILAFAEAISPRLLDVVDRFKPQLLAAQLPLIRQTHSGLVDLVQTLLEICTLMDAFAAVHDGDDAQSGDRQFALAAMKMRLACEAYLLSCMGGLEAFRSVWSVIGSLIENHADAIDSPDLPKDVREVLTGLKRILATAVLQPESLTVREQAWVFDYLELIAATADLSWRQIQPEESVFWLEVNGSSGPIATIRRPPLPGSKVLYFSAMALAKRMAEQIEWLELRVTDAELLGLERDGDLLDPDSSGLPMGLKPVEALSLMRRMRDRWSLPASRTLPRRRTLYEVQVCVGLRNIWRMLKRGKPDNDIDNWRVVNESPGGYALLSVGDFKSTVTPGDALILRQGIGEPWILCVVRWLRHDRADSVEVGLKVISHDFYPLSIVFRGSGERGTTPALGIPAGEQRARPSVMTPAGTYSSRRFVMVRDMAQLYVAQGRVINLETQTAGIELFQYEIDPYPI